MPATRTAWGRAGLVLLAVLVLDQVTKALVRADVAVGEERVLLGPIDLVHVRNRGVAFSFLQDQVALVVGVIVVAMVALVWWFARQGATRLAWLPAGMLAGGALGNVVDRVRLGAVTDFVKAPAWPAFNVADVAITVGVLALVLVIEAGARRAEREAAEGARGGAADPA